MRLHSAVRLPKSEASTEGDMIARGMVMAGSELQALQIIEFQLNYVILIN